MNDEKHEQGWGAGGEDGGGENMSVSIRVGRFLAWADVKLREKKHIEDFNTTHHF